VVVAPDATVVGLGYHERAGRPHAEIVALTMAGERARGSTLYSTLEPCAHTGRTGPCCVAIAEAGIVRVVVAGRDPNPLVAGRGLAFLRERGVDVQTGLLAAEADRLNVAFLTSMKKGRPWVVLKVALSAEAAVADASGGPTRLTSAEADRLVHRFRAEVDAIAVGSATVLADNPRLTARGVFRERPLSRIVFDSRLRTPPDAAVFDTIDAGPVLIVTTPDNCAQQASRTAALRARGADFILADEHDVVAALGQLTQREIRSIVFEGGPLLHAAIWRAGIVDAVHAFITPRVLGPRSQRWEMPNGFSLAGLSGQRVTPVGPDVLLEGQCSPD
ncbi:MAG: bifunctional diaminohydroxyphosphoribosylaminopyrimidine deaminase/5-amino-6-(5-phosphoribosylamino)uracil reductase RibD, partial [Vicinamibacterales bacterium]